MREIGYSGTLLTGFGSLKFMGDWERLLINKKTSYNFTTVNALQEAKNVHKTTKI